MEVGSGVARWSRSSGADTSAILMLGLGAAASVVVDVGFSLVT